MIALFNTEKESIEFSDKIHDLLCKKIKGYVESTSKWSNVNKSDNDNKWCVKLPHNYEELELDIRELKLIEKLPDNWYKN